MQVGLQVSFWLDTYCDTGGGHSTHPVHASTSRADPSDPTPYFLQPCIASITCVLQCLHRIPCLLIYVGWNLQWPFNLMSLGWERKLGQPGKTHPLTGRTCKLQEALQQIVSASRLCMSIHNVNEFKKYPVTLIHCKAVPSKLNTGKKQ